MSNETPKPGHFCWNELATNDVAGAKEFYGSLFGWETHDIDMGDMTYTMVKKDDKDIAGIMQLPKEVQGKVPPHWMSYVTVEDVDAMLTKAQELGAKVTVPVMQAGDYGRLAVIEDPTGAHIAFWQQLKSC